MGLHCSAEAKLEGEVRKIKDVRWNGEGRYWYLPLSREDYQRAKVQLKDKAELPTAE